MFDISRKSLTTQKFEHLYRQLPPKYNVVGFKCPEETYCIRANFAQVYNKEKFYPFVITTARSEGTNNLFIPDVGSKYNLMSFMHEFKGIAAILLNRKIF